MKEGGECIKRWSWRRGEIESGRDKRREWDMNSELEQRERWGKQTRPTGRENKEKSRNVGYGCWFLPAGVEGNHGNQDKEWCHHLQWMLGMVGIFWGVAVWVYSSLWAVYCCTSGEIWWLSCKLICVFGNFHFAFTDNKRCALTWHQTFTICANIIIML